EPAVPAQFPRERVVADDELVRDQLCPRLVVPRDPARDRLIALERPRRTQSDDVADRQRVAVGAGLDLDPARPDVAPVAGLPPPGEAQPRLAAELPGQDRRERPPLLLVSPLVDVDDEAPRRAGLVVVVANRERRCQAAQIDVARVAVLDEPGEDAEA